MFALFWTPTTFFPRFFCLGIDSSDSAEFHWYYARLCWACGWSRSFGETAGCFQIIGRVGGSRGEGDFVQDAFNFEKVNWGSASSFTGGVDYFGGRGNASAGFGVCNSCLGKWFANQRCGESGWSTSTHSVVNKTKEGRKKKKTPTVLLLALLSVGLQTSFILAGKRGLMGKLLG